MAEAGAYSFSECAHVGVSACLVKCGILVTALCSACMNNECTGGGGGQEARASLQTTERSCLFVQCPSTDVKRS